MTIRRTCIRILLRMRAKPTTALLSGKNIERLQYTILQSSRSTKMKISSINDVTQEDFPPHPYIEQIALNCPETQSTYIRMWRLKNSNYKIIVSRKEIQKTFLRLVSTFECNLMKLCAQGLLSYRFDKKKKYFEIELIGWSNDSGEN